MDFAITNNLLQHDSDYGKDMTLFFTFKSEEAKLNLIRKPAISVAWIPFWAVFSI